MANESYQEFQRATDDLTFQVEDVLRWAQELVNVAQSGELGALAFASGLDTARVGSRSQVRDNISVYSRAEGDDRYRPIIGENNNGNYIVFPNGWTVVSRRVTIEPGEAAVLHDFPVQFRGNQVWWAGFGGGWSGIRPTGGSGYISRLRAALGTIVGIASTTQWEVTSRLDTISDQSVAPFDAVLLCVGVVANAP